MESLLYLLAEKFVGLEILTYKPFRRRQILGMLFAP